jgi:major membrane immunogen (membrane-anchored lipoprotein)
MGKYLSYYQNRKEHSEYPEFFRKGESMKKLVFCAILLIGAAGCSEAYRAKNVAYWTGNGATIHVLSGGKVERTYETNNKPFSEENSDGYFFVDAKTGKLVEVAADVIIEYK